LRKEPQKQRGGKPKPSVREKERSVFFLQISGRGQVEVKKTRGTGELLRKKGGPWKESDYSRWEASFGEAFRRGGGNDTGRQKDHPKKGVLEKRRDFPERRRKSVGREPKRTLRETKNGWEALHLIWKGNRPRGSLRNRRR